MLQYPGWECKASKRLTQAVFLGNLAVKYRRYTNSATAVTAASTARTRCIVEPRPDHIQPAHKTNRKLTPIEAEISNLCSVTSGIVGSKFWLVP